MAPEVVGALLSGLGTRRGILDLCGDRLRRSCCEIVAGFGDVGCRSTQLGLIESSGPLTGLQDEVSIDSTPSSELLLVENTDS